MYGKQLDPASFMITSDWNKRKYASLGVSAHGMAHIVVLYCVSLIIFKILIRQIDDTLGCNSTCSVIVQMHEDYSKVS